jgi:hypothetical protein
MTWTWSGWVMKQHLPYMKDGGGLHQRLALLLNIDDDFQISLITGLICLRLGSLRSPIMYCNR